MSTYALDSSAALTYIAANVSATTYHNRFYQSPILPDGLHTLVITITSKGSLYWLDYFLYTPSSNDLTAAPMSILSSTSLAESLSTTSFVRSTASSTSSSCDHPPNSQSSSFSVGAVAGALVGGLILLALLDVGLLYYWKKRFARARSDKREDYGSPGKLLYAPKSFEFATSTSQQFIYRTSPAGFAVNGYVHSSPCPYL